MNNPNPFVPQGSLLEQEKRRSRMKLAVFCVLAVGVCGLTAMLTQGCNKVAENPDIAAQPDTNNFVADSTNNPTMGGSNMTAIVPAIPTNEVVVPPVEPASSEYKVVAHDTLGKIAKAHGVTLKALEAANPGVVPTKLKVGQPLVIPAAAGGTTAPVATDATAPTATGEEIYSVKSGDNLTKIAGKYGVSVKAITALNNLTTDQINHIKVNQKLKIPAKAGTAVAAPAPVVSPAPAAPMLTTKPVH